MSADDQISAGAGEGACSDSLAWLWTMRVLSTPMVRTTTTSTRLLSARTSEVIRRSWVRFNGPVRGGMFSRLVPARLRVAEGVSPMESTAMKPTRTPYR